MPARYHLLPYERWYVERQQGHVAGQGSQMQMQLREHFGPDGVVLLIAAQATVLIAPLGIAGIVLAFASVGAGLLGLIGYLMLGTCVVAMISGFVRACRGIQAGRRFRSKQGGTALGADRSK